MHRKTEWDKMQENYKNKCVICGKPEKKVGELEKVHIKEHSRIRYLVLPMCANHHKMYAKDQLSNKDLKKIDIIAFSAGPGLGPSLRTGATVARALSIWLDRPLVPIHHAIGHIEIGALTTGVKDPLVILVSGGQNMRQRSLQACYRCQLPFLAGYPSCRILSLSFPV